MTEDKSMRSPLLSMKGITKRFPGVLALDNVDLELYEDEILGIVGENGAGKSTLMRILGGDYKADHGQIFIEGREVEIGDVQDSIALGISLIHQELCLAGNLDIASNIFLGHEPRLGTLWMVDKRTLYHSAGELAKQVGIQANLRTIVDDLSPGEQQLVEIAKALSHKVRILILDEPTSSLSPAEAEKLFDVMKNLKKNGVAMIYISHRLSEIEEICDRVIVLKDGQRVGQLEKENIRRAEMVKLMVGRDISRFFPEHGAGKESEVVLSVKNLRYPGGKSAVNFDLRRGEILGIAGLVGSGRTELLKALFGIEQPFSGEIWVAGHKVIIRSPSDAVNAGMGLVPEDRKELGVILEMNVVENISLPGIGRYKPPFLDSKRELQVASEQVHALDIKTPSLQQEVQFLSGGTQQKVGLAKWLSLEPKILILDEPTRGIDVGSKSEIYKLVRSLADNGISVIMASSEMEEIIGLSDRVLVMHEGKCAGILERDQLNEENIMNLATGGGVSS